jgi:Uma2 family endonuclease
MLVNLKAIASLVSDDELLKVSSDNPDFRFERNKEGKLIIMSPTGSSTGEKNSSLLIQVGNWNLSTKKGKIFDSSTGFKFSDGAVRSPDVSWIELSRWNELTQEQQDKFAPIDPDFVIELKSPNDKLSELQQKMSEYMSCGVRLGWLINPQDKQVEIYRQGQSKEVLDKPGSLSGEDVLTGLEVDLTDIF